MMLGRFEMPVTKKAPHMEKATYDELNQRQNAGIVPIKYQHGQLLGVSSQESATPSTASDSPRSTLRRCLNQADLLAKGSFRIESFSNDKTRESISGSATRMGGCGLSAAHVVLTDELLDFDPIIGIQRRSLSKLDMEDIRDMPKATGRFEMRYSSILELGLQKISSQPSYEARTKCDLLDASVPLMMDPLSKRAYGSSLQRALNPDLAALPITTKLDTSSAVSPYPIQLVPASVRAYLSSLTDEELRKTVVLGGAGWPSTGTISKTKRTEAINAYPEALLKHGHRTGMTTQALSELVGTINDIFSEAQGDRHVFSVGRLLACGESLLAHTANGLKRFSGAGLKILGSKADSGAVHGVHIAPGEGITGEYNLAVALDALGPSIMIIGDVLPTEDSPSDPRWLTDLGKSQKRALLTYLAVTIPRILEASNGLRKLALSGAKKGRRNPWLQALVHDAYSTYRNVPFQNEPRLLSKRARSKIADEQIWRAVEDYILLSKDDFLVIAGEDFHEEGPSSFIQKLNRTFKERGPLSLSFLNFPSEIVAENWETLFGVMELIVREWDGPERFERLKKDWTPDSTVKMQQGIYEMQNALSARLLRQAEVRDDIRMLRGKLRRLGHEEKIFDVMDEVGGSERPVQWTNWNNVERLKAYKGASLMVTAAGSQLLTAKDSEVDLVPAPGDYYFGPEGCPIPQDEPRQSARTLYQIGLANLADVLRADFTKYELKGTVLAPLERRSCLVDITECPGQPLSYAELYERVEAHSKTGFTVGAITDLYETSNFAVPFGLVFGKARPETEGSKFKVIQVEVDIDESIEGLVYSLDDFVAELQADPAFGLVQKSRVR